MSAGHDAQGWVCGHDEWDSDCDFTLASECTTHLNSMQGSHGKLPGGLSLCLGYTRRDKNKEEESHQGPPRSISLASCVSSILQMKILSDPSLVFANGSCATRKNTCVKQQSKYRRSVTYDGVIS